MLVRARVCARTDFFQFTKLKLQLEKVDRAPGWLCGVSDLVLDQVMISCFVGSSPRSGSLLGGESA